MTGIITFGLQVVEWSPLFPYILEKRLANPTPLFFKFTSKCFLLLSEHTLCRVGSPTNTKFKLFLQLIQVGMTYTHSLKHRTSYFKSTFTFLGPVFPFCSPTKMGYSCELFNIIRECVSTLNVWLAHTQQPWYKYIYNRKTIY